MLLWVSEFGCDDRSGGVGCNPEPHKKPCLVAPVAQPDHGAPPTVPIAGAQHILHKPGAPPAVPIARGEHILPQSGAPHAEPIAMGPHVPSQPGAPHAEPIASMGPHVLSQPGTPQAMPIVPDDALPSAAADDEEVNLENTHQSKVESHNLLVEKFSIFCVTIWK